MDEITASALRAQAAKCRRLATGADSRTVDALLELAKKYEADAAELERAHPSE